MKKATYTDDDRVVTRLMSGIFDDEIEDGSMPGPEMIQRSLSRYWKHDDGYAYPMPWWFGIACEARKIGLSVDVDTDDRRGSKNYAIKLDGSQYPLAILTDVTDDGPEALDVVMHEIERLIAHPDEIVPVNDDGADDTDDWIGIDGEGPVASMMHWMRRSHERVADRIRLLNLVKKF